MKFLWLALALLFQVCSTSNLSFPMHHHILLLQKQSKANSQIKEQALSNFVTFLANNSANHSEILLNVTVLDQEQDDSLIHIKTMSAFCELTASRGVSFIISLDKMSHPNVIDIYAGYIGIPVLKMFYSDQPHPVKQVSACIQIRKHTSLYRNTLMQQFSAFALYFDCRLIMARFLPFLPANVLNASQYIWPGNKTIPNEQIW